MKDLCLLVIQPIFIRSRFMKRKYTRVEMNILYTSYEEREENPAANLFTKIKQSPAIHPSDLS